MKNFKEETIEAIKESGHNINDVMFIGSNDGKYRMDIDKFLKMSDFYYDEGFGSQSIAIDLIIYFKDRTYMHRNEYDGSEWWACVVKRVFNEKDEHKKFCTLGGDEYMSNTLKDINKKQIKFKK